ncbi:glycosyltransferase family 39 protein [Streptococcus marmotae]|uniref:glycosyltransferase family 39 protein n=1 Tax=Streptococcus marmotae TaxID=1825069 RepID=UPI000A64523A|nr:glycosyltransferase family 39 protein [Streptococcus marmotae]
MYQLFFKYLQKIMWLLLLFWLAVVIKHLLALPWIGIGLTIVIFLLYLVKKELLGKAYAYAMRHKKVLLTLALLFQIAVVLSANLLVRRDAAVVITGALHLIEEQSISNYLTRNPNNLAMFLYARGLYHLFGKATIWVLQVLGILYMNGTAYILYRVGRDFFSQRVADMFFGLYLLLLGFSPYVIQTYTDITSLPFLAGQLYIMVALLKEKCSVNQGLIGLGVITAVASLLRPTALISVIAFSMVLFLKGNWQRFIHAMVVLGCSFGLVFGSLSYGMNQQEEVRIIHDETLAKGLTTFINLGLTYSGTDQEDMKKGLLQYLPVERRSDYNNGMFAQVNEIKEIKRRLHAYTPVSFMDHLGYKLKNTLYDGALNWLYTKPEDEKTPLISPLYVYTKDNVVAEVVRQSVIQYDGRYYVAYKAIKQVVWLVTVIGLFGAVWRYRSDDVMNFLSLGIFGGILFLMIFEGGKTRYLLQFFPQIVLLSSLGLTRMFKKERKL